MIQASTNNDLARAGRRPSVEYSQLFSMPNMERAGVPVQGSWTWSGQACWMLTLSSLDYTSTKRSHSRFPKYPGLFSGVISNSILTNIRKKSINRFNTQCKVTTKRYHGHSKVSWEIFRSWLWPSVTEERKVPLPVIACASVVNEATCPSCAVYIYIRMW